MNSINITARSLKQNQKEICLGNGYRHQFKSLREANKFIADTNRFLTETLVILNFVYVDAFSQYRQFWFTASNLKNGKKTNNLDKLHKIKSMLQAADETFDKFNNSLGPSNDYYFSFINLKKASLFLSEALTILEDINRKRNLTAAMYACMILNKRCALIKLQLEYYPKNLINPDALESTI